MARKKRPQGHGKRYFDWKKGRLYENVQNSHTTSRAMPPEFFLGNNGCRLVYRDTREDVPNPLRFSEAAGYVIRQGMDEVFDVPAIDDFTGKPEEFYEWRDCIFIPGEA